jgi:dTDP-4-dehydrorhamnose reductase
MRILITGAAGMLGQDLVRAAAALDHDVTALARADLDIADPAAVSAAITAASPDVVVNCAAYTNVDGAETDLETAHLVNGAAAGTVAAAAARARAWTIHISSDYVFDGRKGAPYLESDATGPLSVYGASKLAGERAVADGAPGRHTIVRSSWLFGTGGLCFPATILRVGAERDELTVVDDQIGCPTFTGHLAEALVALAREPASGVVHVAGGGHCSWFEFAREIVAAGALSCSVVPGSTADLGRPAPRPAFSVLRSERTGAAPELPDWREGLAAYMTAGVRA